jgi:hypothetical protein
MTAIRKMVLSEPLFETHTHQNRFDHHDWGKMGYRDLIMYGVEDLTTSSGQSYHEIEKAHAIFDHWPDVRSTGYGQATELACRVITGLAFTQANASAITRKMQALIQKHGPQGVFRLMYQKANVQWSINDSCWHFVTPINVIAGEQSLGLMHHALRHDGALVPRTCGDLEKIATELQTPIHTLADLDGALEGHTRKAHATGRLAAIKIGVAYHRDLCFGEASSQQAEAAFKAIHDGRPCDPKPLHDYLLHHTIQRAGDLRLPVQIHTGYLSGTSQDFRRSDPTHLIPVLAKYRDVRFDLFHAGWPYCSAMAAIGKSFPNVWLDLCWMWALSPVEAVRVLDEWLGAVPSSKILGFGADTWTPFGMTGYAMQARHGIASTLEQRMARGDCDLATAKHIAANIMHRNACRLYGLG